MVPDLERWTVEQSGTSPHQIPVIAMDINQSYRWSVDW